MGFVCERVPIEGGQLNIYGVADRIAASAFPIDIQRVHLAAKLNGTPGAKHRGTCTVSDGTTTRPVNEHVDVVLNENGMTITGITVTNLRVTGPSVYTFAVIVDGTEIGHVHLPMNRQIQ